MLVVGTVDVGFRALLMIAVVNFVVDCIVGFVEGIAACLLLILLWVCW